MIDGPTDAEDADRAQHAAADARERAAQLVAEGMRAKQVARALADELGIPRNEAYEIALEASRS